VKSDRGVFQGAVWWPIIRYPNLGFESKFPRIRGIDLPVSGNQSER
jgi:hypothetical protein